MRAILFSFAVQVSVAPFTWSHPIFEAGSDFGQIGPAVSAAVTAAARSFAPVNSVASQIFEAGNDFGQIGPAVSGGGFRSFV